MLDTFDKFKKKNGPLRICIASQKDGFVEDYKKFRKTKKYFF